MKSNFLEIMENSDFFDSIESEKPFPFKVLILTSSNYDKFDAFFKNLSNVEIHQHDKITTKKKDFERYDLVWIYGLLPSFNSQI